MAPAAMITTSSTMITHRTTDTRRPHHMPTTEEVRSDLAEIVNEVSGVPAEDVQLDKSFTDDLDVDSLSMVEIIYAAEEKFGVSIPDEEAKNLKTVGDAVAYIERAAA
jgi:acyl carrier protein